MVTDMTSQNIVIRDETFAHVKQMTETENDLKGNLSITVYHAKWLFFSMQVKYINIYNAIAHTISRSLQIWAHRYWCIHAAFTFLPPKCVNTMYLKLLRSIKTWHQSKKKGFYNLFRLFWGYKTLQVYVKWLINYITSCCILKKTLNIYLTQVNIVGKHDRTGIRSKTCFKTCKNFPLRKKPNQMMDVRA